MIENRNMNDDKMRELMSGSKLSASENLQHRIMQQIMTEKALKPHKVKSAKPTLRIVITMAVVIYILAMVIAAYTYMIGGLGALASKEFIIPVLAIASVCSVCGLVTILDEKRYQR